MRFSHYCKHTLSNVYILCSFSKHMLSIQRTQGITIWSQWAHLFHGGNTNKSMNKGLWSVSMFWNNGSYSVEIARHQGGGEGGRAQRDWGWGWERGRERPQYQSQIVSDEIHHHYSPCAQAWDVYDETGQWVQPKLTKISWCKCFITMPLVCHSACVFEDLCLLFESSEFDFDLEVRWLHRYECPSESVCLVLRKIVNCFRKCVLAIRQKNL